MNNVAESNNMTAQCYDNSQNLEIRLWDDTNNTLAGVQFSDSLSGQNNLDADLTVAIRYALLSSRQTQILFGHNIPKIYLWFPQMHLCNDTNDLE